MKTFRFYQNPERPPERVQVVKVGFSWPGFLFGVIWLLTKRLWVTSLLLTLAWFALFVVASLVVRFAWLYLSSSDERLILLSPALGLAVLVGVYGNGWWEERLQNSGYRPVGSVEAKSRRDSLQRLRGSTGA